MLTAEANTRWCASPVRTAVDEHFAEHRPDMVLNRIDYTGRIGTKLPGA
jgi:hypothetical protein